MAAVVGVCSALPGYFTGEDRRPNPVVLAFQKELGYFAASLRKDGKPVTAEFRQKASSVLFNLWNSYEGRLPGDYFTQQLLATGDLLYQTQEYGLARTHCYGRHLVSERVTGRGEGGVAEYCRRVDNSRLVSSTLRAVIGDAACQYYLSEKEDPKLMHAPSRTAVLKALQQLQQSTQVALQREPLYWLVYNGVVLLYSIGRRMMALGHADKVLEYLLWGAVCMESSVPLMAVKYLQLRVNLYVAVCQCYYDIRRPLQAELFARRGLDQVHELAQLEHQSAGGVTGSSEQIFREVTVKLGVMVFRRSVLESRKRTKSVFRPKVRQTIRDLLQHPSPRSPTEKLLTEMFSGRAAQFLAIVEALRESSRRALDHAPPSPVSELDPETITDVYQELFCIGTDIALKVLEHVAMETTDSLMTAASRAEDGVPLCAVVQFVRVARSCEQREVVEMLAERAVLAAKSSGDPVTEAQGRALRLILSVDQLLSAQRRQRTTTAGEEGRQGGSEASEDPLTRLLYVLEQLHSVCCHGNDPLLTSERDLLLDTAVLLWEGSRATFARVHSHNLTTTRQLLAHENGDQYLAILRDLVEVFVSLSLWQVDPLLHGELCLKLACLYEAIADTSSKTAASSLIPYDRSRLLVCLSVLQEGLRCITQARRAEYRDQPPPQSPNKVSELQVLHAEYLYVIIRVQLKLASTIPPPPPGEGTQKPSSLKSKVRERRERAEQRQRLLAGLTAGDTAVEDEGVLLRGCGKDHYCTALLLMLQAVESPLPAGGREALLEEAYGHLTQLNQVQRTSLLAPPTSLSPPPPLLLWTSDTSMAFCPAPFSPDRQQVAYYQLLGRPSAGSNVKVRLADKHLPGLGIQVPAGEGCVLEVCGLQPREEYVFAVAAYSRRGELVGGAVGQTSRPVLAAFSLPPLAAWGYCCQCAYSAGVHSVAKKAASVLWEKFVYTVTEERQWEELQSYKLRTELTSSVPAALLRQLVQSVFIHTQIAMAEGALLSDQLCVGGPLRPSQEGRLELCRRLLVALEVSGMLNDASLCLQAVVMCYGLLAPLLQYNITAKPLVQVLLWCHAALGELPESLLVHKHPPTSSSLHHMIASTAYHAGKVILSWQKKPLFSLLSDNARGLLLMTMPSSPSGKPAKETQSGGSGLQQPSSVSTVQDLSMSSYTTISSGLPGLLPQRGGQKKRRGKRKTTTAVEQLTDESKTPEYKAFEAFLMANHGQSWEDIDLTGQEDTVILHAVVASLPSQTAYREVHKFRRRPQYLEFFVHLVTATVAKGHHEWVIEWGQDAFTWLARRNELLLSPKAPQAAHTQKTEHSKPPPPRKERTSVPGSSTCTALVAVKTAANATAVVPKVKRSASITADTLTKSKQLVLREERHGALKKARPPLTPGADVRITKTDLEMKAHSVLQTLLPEMWRMHRCRKRLRAVCSEELPWRAQANLLLGTSCLEVLCGRLRQFRGALPELEDPSVQPEWVQFDTAGVLMSGVIPVHNASLPGPAHLEREEGREAEATPPQSKSPILLEELRQTMRHFQRAVVLSHRGEHWILLQNACRALWNAITALVGTLQHCTEEENHTDGVSLASVYGLACRPLYFAASALNDMLLHCGRSVTQNEPPLPLTSSLHFTPGLDDCSAVDTGFVRRLVFLALQVMHTHQHWEKTVAIATRFDDITRHSWAEQLIPVIVSAQERLAARVQAHKIVTREVLEPAAHLDPGPDGHNVYGAVGHALTLVSVSLDTMKTLHRIATPISGSGKATPTAGERALLHSRRLAVRYLAGTGNGGRCSVGVPTQIQYQLPVEGGSGVDLPPLPPSLLPTILGAYEEAVRALLSHGQRGLAAQAMHELGNLLLHCGNTRSARQWWIECLQTLLQSRDPLNSWRRLLLGPREGRGTPAESWGVWGCLLAAVLAAKLAKYVYRNELDIRLEYTQMAACLFKSLHTSSLPHPLSDITYATHPLPTEGQIVPGLDLFGDRFRCDPSTLLDCLCYCAQELVSRKHTVKALPVLWLYQYVAIRVCRDVQHAVEAKILRLCALVELSLFSESLHLLAEILTGARLPQATSEHDRPPDSHMGLVKFDTTLPLNDPKNHKSLLMVLERPLGASQAGEYRETTIARLALARARLYTAMAATCSPVPSQPILCRGEQAHVRSSTATTPNTSAPSSATNHHTGATSRRQRLTNTTEDMKLLLLDHAERLLVALCQELGGKRTLEALELRTRALLQLAEVALALYHSSSAVQLGLAAMRLLQGVLEGGGGESPPPVHGGLVDMRLWLECRVTLARSLIGTRFGTDGGEGGGEVDCGEVCGEGLRESGACGEGELAAVLHHTAALHAMAQEPPDLETVSTHTQSALQALSDLQELSPRARVLRCEASLLLADASCVGGGAEEEMVTVFQGLTTMIQEQMQEECVGGTVTNIYKPQWTLLASCKLRLAHTLSLLSAQTPDPTQRMEYRRLAQRACEEGMEAARSSAFVDPCLMAELKFHYGWIENMLHQSSAGSRQYDDNALLQACRTIADYSVDYRLAFNCYCGLAEAFATLSKQQNPFRKAETPVSPSLLTIEQRRVSRSPSSRIASRGSHETVSKAEREWVKERVREGYFAWCLVKSAQQTLCAMHKLQLLAAELHNEEVTKPLPDKALTKLPDFALLEMCRSTTIMDTLTNTLEVLPIEVLAPSAQSTHSTGLNWFQVASYTNTLLQKCFWQKPSLSSSVWELHYNTLTPRTYPKCKAMLSFLAAHFPQFATECKLPPPPSLFPPPSTKTPLPSTPATPAQQSTVPPQTARGASPDGAHLKAGDTELTVLWCKPFLGAMKNTDSTNTSQKQAATLESDLVGLFAMNLKPVKTHPPSSLTATEAEVHVVWVSSGSLSVLRSHWEELSSAARAYLDVKATARPLSRSPSKQKKTTTSERMQKASTELQSKLLEGVKKLCETFGFNLPEDNLPRVEPHSVASIAKVLQPFTDTSVKGDAYYFFKHLFTSASPSV